MMIAPQISVPKNWLLLRGWSREIGHWDQFPKIFEDQLKCKTHMFDLPGGGTERFTKSPLEIKEITEILRKKWLFRKEKWKGSWNILGLSMGGMVSLDWTSRYPSDFDSAVIINCSSSDLSHPLQRLQPHALQLILKTAIKDKEKMILTLVSNLRATDTRLVSEWQRIARLRPCSPQNIARQLIAATRFKAPQGPLTPRTLFLNSLMDKMVNPHCSTLLANKYNAPLLSHLSAGHDLPIDDAFWVSQQVLQFQKQNDLTVATL